MALLAIGGSAWAQTDVTSTYLTNADFEGTYSVETSLNGGDRAIYKPDGWTVTRESGNQYDMTALNSNCLAWNNFSGKAQLASGGNNTYWIRIKNGTPKLKLTQEVTLPAGSYTFSADAYKNGSGGEHYLMANGKEVSLSGNEDTWRKLSIDFVLLQETTVTLGFRYQHNSAGNEKFIAFDNFKLIANYIADATESNPVDITALVGTAKANWTGATEEGAATGSDGASINRVSKYSEQHFTGDVMSQTINDLPLGKYNVEYYANANCAAWNCSPIAEADGATDRTVFYANDASAGVPILNDGKSLPSGKMTLREALTTTVQDGKLTLKLVNEKQGANWISVQIKSLKYLGIDLQIWTDAKTAAQTALDKYDSKYATAERQAVVDAMGAANPTTVAALESQVNDLNTKVAAYTKKADNEILIEQKAGLVAAIARIKTEYPNSSDAVLNPDISKWTTSTYTANNGNQHWSGAGSYKYYEQSLSNPDMWTQNSWSIAAEQTINLPAGKYAFVVTARGSGDVTSKMTVDGQEVALSTVGDVGYGVATDGECTYDMSKTYTNNGNGRGWEYAYAEFTVTEAKDVTFRLESSTNAVHNWVSIANPILYYNDDAKAEMEKINAKAELSNTLQKVMEEKPAPTENIGDGVFQYSQTNIDAYNQVFTDAQAVLDNAESTTQNYVDAKATLDNIQYPALNAPDAEQAYKMVQNSLSLNPETNSISSTESAVWFEAATGGYKIKSNTDLYIKYKGGDSYTMATTDDANSAEVFAVDYTATKGLTFKGNKGLYGGDNNTDGSLMYGNKGTGNKVFWSVSEVVVTEDYTALQTALAAKTLGFEEGEYAPYTNVEAAVAYNAAKAINQSVPNVASVVETVTNNLNNATWTAINTEEMNAVYDGTFANAENNGAPAGWTMSSNTLGGTQHSRAFVGEDRLAEFNDTKSGLFIRFDDTNSGKGAMYYYGKTDGYTMPLKENTTYYVSVDFDGWGSKGNNLRMNVTGPNNFSEYSTVKTAHDADKENETPQNNTIVFTTGAAGDYVISFQNPGASVNQMAIVSNIVLKKAVEQEFKITSAGWATLVTDLSKTTKPEAVTVYEVTAGAEDTDVTLSGVDNIEPNKPYLISGESSTYSIFGCPVAKDATPTNGLLVGNWNAGATITGDGSQYLLQKHDSRVAFYLLANDATAKLAANSAYLKKETTSPVKAFYFDGLGDETAISALEALTSGNAKIYDLNGRQIQKLQKGVNIVNGKKIIVK